MTLPPSGVYPWTSACEAITLAQVAGSTSLPVPGALGLGLPHTMELVSVGAPSAHRIPSPPLVPRLPVIVQFRQVTPPGLLSYTAPPRVALLPTKATLVSVTPPEPASILRPPPSPPPSARLPLKT